MRHTLNINGTLVSAETGDTLVDAALTKGILIPHDCATGQCETCRVRIAHGGVDGAGTEYGDTVLACQARITGDAAITYDAALPVEQRAGFVETIQPLSDDVLEVMVRLKEPLLFRPGQYTKLAFRGFPPREYSFTTSMGKSEQPDQVVFHIKRLKQGLVSSQIGKQIGLGHRIRLSGPYGSAYLREQETGPIVLASTGTGFAPIWSLAKAAIRTGNARKIALITDVRDPRDTYMLPALRWIATNSNAQLLLTSKTQTDSKIIRLGTPDQHLPNLDSQTSVHVAGNPLTVESTRDIAAHAGAQCYADPFIASRNTRSFMDRLRDLSGGLG